MCNTDWLKLSLFITIGVSCYIIDTRWKLVQLNTTQMNKLILVLLVCSSTLVRAEEFSFYQFQKPIMIDTGKLRCHEYRHFLTTLSIMTFADANWMKNKSKVCLADDSDGGVYPGHAEHEANTEEGWEQADPLIVVLKSWPPANGENNSHGILIRGNLTWEVL